VSAPESRPLRVWPIAVLALPAAVAIWSGWVGLGQLTGFGLVQPFPGIPVLDQVRIDSAITLPVGMEAYAAYALHVWLSGRAPARAQAFARRSAIGALTLGALGQVAYHLMAAAGWDQAPWLVTTVVACLPVAVLGMGAALGHLIRAPEPTPVQVPAVATSPAPGETPTSVPGAGGTPPADPPRGRATKTPGTGRGAGKTPDRSRDEVAAAYVAACRQAGKEPTAYGLTKAVRDAGHGIGSGPAEDLLARLTRPHAVPEVARA
jgi:hypothetical protein